MAEKMTDDEREMMNMPQQGEGVSKKELEALLGQSIPEGPDLRTSPKGSNKEQDFFGRRGTPRNREDADLDDMYRANPDIAELKALTDARRFHRYPEELKELMLEWGAKRIEFGRNLPKSEYVSDANKTPHQLIDEGGMDYPIEQYLRGLAGTMEGKKQSDFLKALKLIYQTDNIDESWGAKASKIRQAELDLLP